MRKLKPSDLKQVADELRIELIDAVSGIGGHFGASLGVVELDGRAALPVRTRRTTA